MNGWADFDLGRERQRELLGEAERWRLERSLRGARRGWSTGFEERARDGVLVRWGLSEDEEGVANLLELNGVPRWVAFEERFIVAEDGGRLLAALRYRTEPKRMSLGLLVADPWAGERRLAVALYSGAADLARELGVREILARPRGRESYLREVGYGRTMGGWRMDMKGPRERGERPVLRQWFEARAILVALAASFRRAFRG